MDMSNDQVHSPADPAANPAQPPDAAEPLARVWEDPVGTGDPVAFDPQLHEPPLSPEEVQELLAKSGS